MHLKLKLMSSLAVIFLASACSSYSTEDYAEPGASQKVTSCINMEPAQQMICEEREKSLLIGLGADKNCNHPYEYEKNRCKSQQAKQQKSLDESLKKRTGK